MEPIDAQLAQLTLHEKAALCLGADMWRTAPVSRLAIPAVRMSDGPHGLRRQADADDHAAISGSEPATCFPTASALASSWNPDLVHRIGKAIGVEARAQGVDVMLGPGINIKRSPLCGRNFEYYSEDPHLAGVLGAAFVAGVQSEGVGACLKHFAVNNQETDRLRVSADVDDRALREIYLSAFEYVVIQARPWTVMCSYNRINGLHASQSRWLLTDILRDEWGFDGLVVSDWGAVHDRVAALQAGLDLEMPPNHGVSDLATVAAVTAGHLAEDTLDQAVRRVLTLAARSEAARNARPVASLDIDVHHALARSAAAECAVLLKNEDQILPLRPRPGDLVAVIGRFARQPRFQGAGSSQVNPTIVDNALDHLLADAPSGVQIAYAPGFGEPDELGGLANDHDDQLADEAVSLAARATTVLAFLGLPAAAESEGYDRVHLNLPGNQTRLLARMAETNPNLVVVLANGAAVQTSTWDQHVRAILECWLPGQAGGGAIADLLYGTVNPSGRLAETIPERLQDNPSYLNFPGEAGRVRYGEGVFVGYRGYDKAELAVSYPFGHGLSYTNFSYTNLTATVTGRPENDDLTVAVSCTVTNTGDRPGKEVVQLYVGDPEAGVSRPVRELKGFAKIDLEPGARATAQFRLSTRDFSYWSTTHHRWLLEPGSFDISIGASSRDLRLHATVDIPGPVPRPTLDAMATLHEWLADAEGAHALQEVIGTEPNGRPRGILADPALMAVLGNFPLRNLATFPGVGLDQTAVADLVHRYRCAGQE
jgi:beta-glucosidase